MPGIGAVVCVVGLTLCGNATPSGVGRVPPGEYVEVDENGVPNHNLRVRVVEVTPNILEVRGINGWVAYASYDEAGKVYRGFFEWQQFGPHRSPGGKWTDLYQVRLTRQENGHLRMTGKSAGNDLVIRAQPAGSVPLRPQSR